MNTTDGESLSLEPFVSAAKAAEFLGIKRKFLLSLARRGIGGSYAIGGDQRHRWVFKLSELGIAIDRRRHRLVPSESRYDPDQGSPR